MRGVTLLLRRAVGAAVLSALAASAPAAAHGGHGEAAVEAARGAVKLRDCWMTVAYVARPAGVLREAFPKPPDLTQTFYGPDPLLGLWAVSCEGARVARKPVGPVKLSLIGVPVGLTVVGAPPLANFLSHALLRAHTDSRPLARALRRHGLPARLARAMRYRHSRRGALPWRGRLTVPGSYGLSVSARQPDPTNPHDHVNQFSFRGKRGSGATLALSTLDASDRFCFPTAGDCTATATAPMGSAMARLLGGGSVTARVGFDHARVSRLHLRAH